MNTELNNSRTKAKRLHVIEKDQEPDRTCPKDALTAIGWPRNHLQRDCS